MKSKPISNKQITEKVSIGGLGIPVDRSKLLLWFKVLAAGYLGYFYFTVQFRTFEILLLTGILILTALLPSYLWCAGKAHGLPIVPVFALSTFPSYILPIHKGSEILKQYTQETEVRALLCLISFLLVVTLVWHQICNNPKGGPKECRMMNLEGSTALLVAFLILGFLFQLLGAFFNQIGGGLFSLIRGYTGNAAMLAMFIFSYRLGIGTLSMPLKILLFGVVGLLIVVEAASFILAGTLVRLAVIGAGYTLGGQKIPWKTAISAIALLSVLHAGKAEMRETYWKEGIAIREFSLVEYPKIFGDWFVKGINVLGKGRDAQEKEVQSAAERGSMIQILFRIIEWTPARKPFLEGETYLGIPSLLVPRILYKEKGIAHIGNWILAYQYEFLTLEGLSKTSVGFDLLSESYANYGYVGMAGLAVFLALFYGWVARLSIGVPLLSLRFLFAVLVLSGTFSSNNTMGVFVTTLWQSSMALLTLGLFLTKKMPNPLFVISGIKTDSKGLEIAGSSNRETEREEKVGNENRNAETAPVRHERPKRFVYGEKPEAQR